MSIVERLRIEAQEICADTYPRWKNADETMNDAADKIEQLREALDLLWANANHEEWDAMAREHFERLIRGWK
jgi:hypothetical protein